MNKNIKNKKVSNLDKIMCRLNIIIYYIAYFAAIIIILIFSFTNVYASNINIDGKDPTWASGHVWTSEIERKNINCARISLYDIQSHQIFDTKTIINTSENDNEKYGQFGNVNKTIIIKSNNKLPIEIGDAITNGSNDEGIIFYDEIELPKLIIEQGQSSSDFLNNIKEYFANENNVLSILNNFHITNAEIEKWNNKQISMLVEPVTVLYSNTSGILLWKTRHFNLFTSAEIGILTYTDTMIFRANDYTNGGKNYNENCYKALPFSCYKAKNDYITQIIPYNSDNSDSFCDTQLEWQDMIKSLGCFELTTNNNDEAIIPEEPKNYDLTYYTDSWVITSCNISSSHGFPRQSNTPGTNKDEDAKNGCLTNKLAKITYQLESNIDLNSNMYTQELAIPEGRSAVSWVKWRCPSEPCDIKINITTNSDDAIPEYNTITIKVIDPINKYPPNNEATDRNDSFIIPTKADGTWNTGKNKSLTWTTYNYRWVSLWVWGCSRTKENGDLTEYGFYENWDDGYICNAHHCPANAESHTCPTGRCHNVVEDWGWVEWEAVEHKLTLNTYNEKLYRSSNTPNTNNSDTSIKSGYGIEYNVDTTCIYKVNGVTKHLYEARNAITPPQYLEVFLPEHEYKTYEIVSFNDIDNGYSEDNAFTFPVCPYSQFEQKCHFTPIWYPDGEYIVGTKISQCFCPGGQLSICNDDLSINIDGNIYDDWHIAPKKN